MELVRGPTLKDILQKHGPLPVERAVRIAGQVCDALAEAHGQPEPIVHRDLKPANIFVEERQGQDWAKVGDFGIAKIVGEHSSGLTHTGASPGTPKYMAPEQWMGREVDGRADLYALGIMIYELLTGRAPFSAAEGVQALMYQHLHELLPLLPPTVPAGIRVQVERLLVKAPQGRPDNALSVCQALEAALRGEDDRRTIVLTEPQRATRAPGELEDRAGMGSAPSVIEEETIVPRTLLQPATMVQPQVKKAEATKHATRGLRLWRYGAAAGSLLLLGLVLGGLWDHFRQPIEEMQPQSTEEQRVTEQLPPQLATTAPEVQSPAKEKEAEPVPQTAATREQEQEQLKVTAKPLPQEQQLQEQAKAQPVESAEDVQRKAEERKQVETDQRVTDLLARAQKQRAAQRLIAPKGNNALETYREVLRITPDHEEAQASIQEIKAQAKQLGEAAEQRGEWTKAQGHYEAALKIDSQDEALRATLQRVKQAQKESATFAGRYETITQTPVLKEPRSDATVLTTLPPAAKVTVVGAVGEYLRVESKKGNPPGYIARQAVMRFHKEPEPTDYAGINKNTPPISQVEVRKSTEEEARRNLENAIVGKWRDSYGDIIMEFFADGTLTESRGFNRDHDVPVRYKIIGSNQLRIAVGFGFFPKVVKVSVSGDELILTEVNGVTTTWRRIR